MIKVADELYQKTWKPSRRFQRLPSSFRTKVITNVDAKHFHWDDVKSVAQAKRPRLLVNHCPGEYGIKDGTL